MSRLNEICKLEELPCSGEVLESLIEGLINEKAKIFI